MTETARHYYTRHDPHHAERYGWEWVSSAACPRRLIRKHCQGNRCWCRNPLNDHGATWRHTFGPNAGEMFVAWQPYSGSGGDNLADLVAGAKRDGLHVSLSNAATWSFPGEPSGCVAIKFYKAL